jgi:MFS family permease
LIPKIIIINAFISKVYKNNKIAWITVSLVAFTLLLDTSLVKISDLVRSHSNYGLLMAIFVAIGIISIVGQQLLLGFAKMRHKEQRDLAALPIKAIHKVVRIIQFSLSGILLFAIVQVLATSYYNTLLVLLATAISYSLAIAMMILLAQRFFSWFRENRNLIILLYGLSSTVVAINAIVIFTIALLLLPDIPKQVEEHVANLLRILQGPLKDIFNYANIPSTILSFMLMWAATALLLRHYSHKIGTIKYWILVSVPLVYFASQFPSLFFNLFASLLILDPVFYGILLTLIFFLSKTAGGIFFGIAFLMVARGLDNNSVVRSYMFISAYGLILLFVSNQALVVWINIPFPAFGLATISFTGLSSYLILLGIYSSAISVAEDSKLRQSIRKFALEESKFLVDIGVAQMEHELEKRVIAITKRQATEMTERTGIEASLSEEDIKQYLDVVLQEVKKDKQNGSTS